jgi:formate hydrogenlyase subunit 3/multisubunit Na+/H+ antiporter MnhD subunit
LNEKHKKINRLILTGFIIIILITQLFIIARDIKEPAWYLKAPFISIIFIVALGIARAFMEWKYAENRKEYIFTISQLSFTLILVLILLSTNFFNFFN